MDLDAQRQLLDAPGIPEVDGELASRVGPDGQVQVEVIEHLRVKVPAAARQAWLEAEAVSWEPWLRAQPGFLGRRLHWDGEREEGQLLIRWASREQWHAIPRDEIEQVQERFERFAHAALERLGVLPELGISAAVGQAAPPAEPQRPEPVHPAGRPTPPNPFPLLYSGELPPTAVAGAPSGSSGQASGPSQPGDRA